MEARKHGNVVPRFRGRIFPCTGPPMKVISMVTQKGGSGKSTLARHLAVAAHLSGLRTVVMDCDMQGSLRDWSEKRCDPEVGNRAEPTVIVELSPNPRHIEARVAEQQAAGVELLVLDTPGGLQTPTPFIAAGLSDLVVVPIRPTGDDMDAFWPLLPRLRESRRDMVVVLSACLTTTSRPRLET